MDLEELIVKGEKFLKEREYKKAEKIFNKAIEKDQNCKEAWYGLGTAVYKLGQEREAISYYNKALSLDQNYIGPLKGIAWISQKMNNLEDAIKYYDKILKIKPSAVILTRKGEVLHNQKKYTGTLECCNKALELDPYYNKAIELKKLVENKIIEEKAMK